MYRKNMIMKKKKNLTSILVFGEYLGVVSGEIDRPEQLGDTTLDNILDVDEPVDPVLTVPQVVVGVTPPIPGRI